MDLFQAHLGQAVVLGIGVGLAWAVRDFLRASWRRVEARRPHGLATERPKD